MDIAGDGGACRGAVVKLLVDRCEKGITVPDVIRRSGVGVCPDLRRRERVVLNPARHPASDSEICAPGRILKEGDAPHYAPYLRHRPPVARRRSAQRPGTPGHRNVWTTQIYTHVTNKRLRDVHEQFHGGQDI